MRAPRGPTGLAGIPVDLVDMRDGSEPADMAHIFLECPPPPAEGVRQHSSKAYRHVGATPEGLGLASSTISIGSVQSACLCDVVLDKFTIRRMPSRPTRGGGGDTQNLGHADRPHGCETAQWVYQVDGTCVRSRGWPTEVALSGRTYRARAALSRRGKRVNAVMLLLLLACGEKRAQRTAAVRCQWPARLLNE